ncbi:MAG TPA: hypothetical protein VG756_16860 [Pseudonocardiaceae bacterium]|jgi:hypothetical protein|nr:hypothetical protein [Pseudonocardiaceae bacterium]
MVRKSGVPVLLAAFAALIALAGCGPASSASAGSSGATSAGGSGGATTTTAPGQSVNPGGPNIPASSTGSPGSPGTAVPGTTVPPSAISGLARIYVPQNQINAAAVQKNAPTQVQTAGGRYVIFTAEQSGCEQITGQATQQTASQVMISVITTNSASGGQMCPMIVRNVQVIVELSAPLNNRTIVFQSVTRHG